MLKKGDRVRMTVEYYEKLLKSTRIMPEYKKTREVGVITKIDGNSCFVNNGKGNWTLKYLELSKEDNEI